MCHHPAPQGLAAVGRGSWGLRGARAAFNKRALGRCHQRHLGQLQSWSPRLLLGEALHKSLCRDWRQAGPERRTGSFSGRAVALGMDPPVSTAESGTSASQPHVEQNDSLLKLS